FGLRLRGEPTLYSTKTKRLTTGVLASAPLELENTPRKRRILLDRTSLEIFANDGRLSITGCVLPPAYNKYLETTAIGAVARPRPSFLSSRREHRHALELFERLNVQIDPEIRCSDLTIAQQQSVEIAKAISLDARILVMDEPTASLTSQEAEKLFQLIGELKRRGIGIIYVSHRMEEIFRLADRVTVMRDGQYVATRPVGQLNRQMLIEMMVGRKLENEFPKERAAIGEERLVVSDLRRGSA